MRGNVKPWRKNNDDLNYRTPDQETRALGLLGRDLLLYLMPLVKGPPLPEEELGGLVLRHPGVGDV